MFIYEKYLACPKCKASLIIGESKIKCSVCERTYKIEDGIYYLLPEYSDDVKLSVEKWDEGYLEQYKSKDYLKLYEKYKNDHYENVKEQIMAEKNLKGSVYLEIGCGPFFLGSLLANDCEVVIGVDFCPHALKIAQEMMKKNNVKNYILIHGDILEMPIKSSSIDYIYGGGVIEHFQNTVESINEIYRVLKPGGITFNTVPYLNLGSLTYRQVWGNIPNFPVLKELAELVHIKLLKGKHMIFGYEFSFTKGKLKSLHEKAGFKNIRVEQFPVKMDFDFLPTGPIRNFAMYLAANSSLFWPMVKVIGVK